MVDVLLWIIEPFNDEQHQRNGDRIPRRNCIRMFPHTTSTHRVVIAQRDVMMMSRSIRRICTRGWSPRLVRPGQRWTPTGRAIEATAARNEQSSSRLIGHHCLGDWTVRRVLVDAPATVRSPAKKSRGQQLWWQQRRLAAFSRNELPLQCCPSVQCALTTAVCRELWCWTWTS